MTYEQIIQKAGKQISVEVYYYDNNVKIKLDNDDFKQAKIFFNSNVIGSVMRGIELETTSQLPDREIYLEVWAKYGVEEVSKLYGKYRLSEEPTYNADTKTYTHKLYDDMLNFMVDYEPVNIIYPTTVYNFFVALIEKLGYTTNIESLPNGNREIKGDIYEGINFTYRDVLDDIGKATATLFRIHTDEVVKCEFGTETIVIDDDILKNQNIKMGQHFGAINTIVLSRGGGADNIYYPEVLPENPIEFKISDNQLMNNNYRDLYLPELYEALNGLEYDIYDCQLVGYGGFEPLQKIQIITGGNTYNSYVLNNEITITQGYEETIYTPLPEENVTDYKVADTTDRRIDNVNLIVNKQEKEIQALAESTIIINDSTAGYKKVSLENVAKNGIGILKITGNVETTLIGGNGSPNVRSGLYKSGTTRAGHNQPYFEKLIVDEDLVIDEVRLQVLYENDEVYTSYLLPIRHLYTLNNVKDEFVLENNKMFLIHRIGLNDEKEKYVLHKPYIEYLGNLIIENPEGNIKLFIDKDVRLETTYLINNEYTNLFAREIDLQSEIKVRNDEITSLVKGKTDKEEIIASINQAIRDGQGIIKIVGNQVIIESDYFKLLADGYIQATGGTVGGYELTNKNLSSELDGIYNYDIYDLKAMILSILGVLNIQDEIFDVYDYNGDGIIRSDDLSRVKGILDEREENTHLENGKIVINSRDPKHTISIINKNDEIVSSMGVGGIDTALIKSKALYVCDEDTTSTTLNNYVGINGDSGSIYATGTVSQGSLKENKKNFEKYNNALNELQNIDIYKYNLKYEDDNHKKHIGFVIGEDFNYSHEITTVNEEGKEIGVDNYSMTSLCLQAIKEQQEIIEKLEKRIANLEMEMK